MIREYEEESHRRATILVDNSLPESATDDDRDALERAIGLAASLASAYLTQGYAVRVVARGAHVPSAPGPAQLLRILRALALLATVTPEVPFAGTGEPGCENLFVARRGAAPAARPPHVGRIMEAS